MQSTAHLLSIGQAAGILGVCVGTVRRWCREGKLVETCRTSGGHRRFSVSSIRNFMGLATPKKMMGYARVSSHDQKEDLKRQAERLKEAGCDEVITDLGSGLNCRKKGLSLLLRAIVSEGITGLMLTHQDRLLRFGSELIFKLCEWFGVEVVILEEKKGEPFELELTRDVITLMTVFSARLYGKRSHRNKKKQPCAPV